MESLVLSAVLFAIVAWCVLAGRFSSAGLTAPIFFVAVGFALATAADPVDHHVEAELVKVVAEVTLVWILFADAASVRMREFRRDLGTYGRLLGVGLPLTVALGTVTAALLLGLDVWAALLLGAALAPTDAALGASVMTDKAVPERIRRVLNVESGLNDGIATPVVLLAIAGVATAEGIAGVEDAGHAVLALVVGVAVGGTVGALGGVVTRRARHLGWLSEELGGPAVLALALLSYTASLVVDGNGFVAAFVGGLVFGNLAGRGGATEVYFVDQSASLAAMVSWLAFGALAVPVIGAWLSWSVVLYAVLSLTVLRMVPVALALLGAGLDRYDVLFVGWFGPRGLASVIFALLALEDLADAGRELVAVIALTVLLSVLLHGTTAGPLARRFRADPDVDTPGDRASPVASDPAAQVGRFDDRNGAD
ncbi:cation:proton antiporter [Nocardioides euryhalodurans]|uniref:Sodium:proton antiporter n=1 Tax=Nocardioides euryhalodurans TaxID=2518370 RepID=A0A4P7GHX4_9ACTN|nr:cation:proton antiporter [Nocardioides euryhalodurans]QBR91528.1 sodium:proton antiporter [Nocardioides euryhalodurans]